MSQSQEGPPPWVTAASSSHPQASSTQGLPSPFGGHNQPESVQSGEVLIGIVCMLLALCTAAVVGRLFARRRAKVALGADDYFALVALVCITGDIIGVMALMMDSCYSLWYQLAAFSVRTWALRAFIANTAYKQFGRCSLHLHHATVGPSRSRCNACHSSCMLRLLGLPLDENEC